ncbi:hypothetical protein AB0N33_07770 [Pseudarthrobacter oxydans]
MTNLYYDTCHPSRWRLEPPRNENTLTVLGMVLTGVDIACAVAGFIVLML